MSVPREEPKAKDRLSSRPLVVIDSFRAGEDALYVRRNCGRRFFQKAGDCVDGGRIHKQIARSQRGDVLEIATYLSSRHVKVAVIVPVQEGVVLMSEAITTGLYDVPTEDGERHAEA